MQANQVTARQAHDACSRRDADLCVDMTNVGTLSTIFQTQYAAFLQNIRAKYPNADIFAMRTFGNHYVTETQAALNARVSAGDAKVHFIDTSGWLDASTDFSDGVHPNDGVMRRSRIVCCRSCSRT